MLNQEQESPSGWKGWLTRLGLRRDPATAARRDAATRIYLETVNQARTPGLFAELGVPDTPEGRFEAVAVHSAMVVRRLGREGRPGHLLAQELFDLMFDDMDQSLREIGVGDMSVGKYVKRLARNFYARLAAIDQAFAEQRPAVLESMLRANVYLGTTPTEPQIARFIDYLERLELALGDQPGADLLAGTIRFEPKP
jgi:cytochrome b pre-mRNA-processing protein 3